MNEVRTGEGGGSSWNLFSEWLNSLPFPDSRWGRREQMDTGRRGRRAWNEGDGRGTDGIGGKLREESGRMEGKFSIWPWAEMKICMYLGAARYCFGMHHFFPQWHLLLKVLRAEPAVQEIHRTVPYIFLRKCSTTAAAGGHLCCVQAPLAMAEEKWMQTQCPKWVGKWKSPRHPSQPRNWSLWFWRGILHPVCC